MSIENLEITEATVEDAERIITLTAQDLREAHLSEDEVLARADVANKEHLKTQEQKLKLQPELYRIARLGIDVVGMIKTNEWFALDQRKYAMSSRESYALTLQHYLFRNPHLKDNPLGIHALVAASDVDGIHQSEIASALLDDALKDHDDKEVRIGIRPVFEPLKPLLTNDKYKFRPTDTYGRPVGIYQRLYISPPNERSLSDQRTVDVAHLDVSEIQDELE